MDNLEKFIQENREKFDPELPEGLWERIESKPSKQRLFNKTWMNVASIAAGVMLLVSLGLVFFSDDDEPKPKERVAIETPVEEVRQEVDLGEISPEYAEIETHYATLVNDRINELNQMNADPELMNELDELEEEYKLLKEELGSGGDDAVIIEAMIENYRIKLKMLEGILDQLKDIENEDVIEVQI